VVHLAFAILDASDATRELNIEGSRRVFERAAKAGAERICYASSVAAYGFHDDNPDWLTEDIPPRGSPEHPYSHQKAEVERVLAEVLLRRSGTVAYAFRPCIVAGPEARTMLDEIPYYRLEEAMPDPVRRLIDSLPVLKPVIPDPGIRFQLVHEDDVASAFAAAVRGLGEPGPYNLAGGGTLTMSDVADALGWYSVPVPKPLVDATAEIVDPLGQETRPDEDRAREEAPPLAPEAHGEGHAEGDGRRSEGGAVQLRVVLLGHLAWVQERRAVAHRPLHERGDAVLRDARLREPGRQAEPLDQVRDVRGQRVADLRVADVEELADVAVAVGDVGRAGGIVPDHVRQVDRVRHPVRDAEVGAGRVGHGVHRAERDRDGEIRGDQHVAACLLVLLAPLDGALQVVADHPQGL
jgi:nucleoside-diphosphate-sugar epimerase